MYHLWEPHRLLVSVNNRASYGELTFRGEGMSGVALKHDVLGVSKRLV